MKASTAAKTIAPKAEPIANVRGGASRKWVLYAVLVFLWLVLVYWLSLGGPLSYRQPPQPEGPPSLLEYLLRPAGHFEPVSHIGYFLQVYRSFFAGGSWNWMVGWDLCRQILQAFLGFAILWAVGWFFIGSFQVFINRCTKMALALPLGIGLSAMLFTVLALAHVLYVWTVWPVILITLAILIRTSRHTYRRTKTAEGTGDENRRIVYEMQQDKGIEWEAATTARPDNVLEIIFAWIMRAIIGVIVFLTFYHAVFFPEVYHDALILYLGYARWIFLEHSFPTKVVAQVGVGLGANYPHLFEVTGAALPTMFGSWSPIYLQFLTPLCGLFSIMLIYQTVKRLSRNLFIALICTLFVQALPYLITYHTWTSNYSCVILFSAAFFYLALRYMEDGLPGYYILATLVVAFAMHINYLMGALWFCWAAMLVLTHWPMRQPYIPRDFDMSDGGVKLPSTSKAPDPESPPGFYRLKEWPRLSQAIREPIVFMTFLIALVIGSIWYVRNWIVTGNPVYAFFSGIFGGKNIDPEVMASADLEWQAHGDGIGVADSLQIAQYFGLPDSDILDRVVFSWRFFINSFGHAYKWAPAFAALVIPGILALLFGSFLTLRQSEDESPSSRIARRFGFVALLYMVILFAYHYLLGPYYLYHLLGCCAVFAVFIWFALRRISGDWRYLFAVAAIVVGLMPGVPWALMGSKIGSADLKALKNPGASKEMFYSWKYGYELPQLWETINERAQGTALLTHENRHLLFDPSIRLLHLDGLEAQAMWKMRDREKLEYLEELGVKYYLRVPFERDHPINERLGLQNWIDSGVLKKVQQAGDNILYRFEYPD